MLARCCLTTESESCPGGSLTGPLIEQCASECVTAAQSMISIVQKHQTHDISMLPAWWYRAFYVYTAAMVLAVSTLRLDLFPRSSTQPAWENSLTLLQAHEHLSDSVRVCKATLQRMFSRIEQTQDVSVSTLLFDSNLPDEQGTTVGECSDFLQDFSLHLNYSSLPNLDNMSWLTNY